jgi:polyisoprenoid-binding protein YceI
MLQKSFPILTLGAALAMAAAPAFAANYVQAKGSTLGFSGNYQGEAFKGRFPGFATVFSFDPAKLATGRLTVVIPLVNATADNPDYDSELRGSAFFDSKKFPQARYIATKFRSLGGNKYAADGTLSLRGISKPVTLTFTWTAGTQPVLTGTAVVKRLDFGVGGGEWADTSVIPNEIQIATKVLFQPK